MTYQVRLSKKAAWQILGLPTAKRADWLALIERLEIDPNHPDRKKVDLRAGASVYYITKSSCECGSDCAIFFSIADNNVHVALLTERDATGGSIFTWLDVANIAERLFLAEPDEIADCITSVLVDRRDDGDCLYRRWMSSHLPAYLLGPARRFFPDRETILTACLDGVERAARKIATAPDHSYDDLWICLEVLEEIAGQIVHDPASRAVFAQRYASMCFTSTSPILRAAWAWGVNELLERGPESTALGLDIARKLLDDGPDEARHVIHVMSQGRKELGATFAAHPGFAAPLPADIGDLLDRIGAWQNQLITGLRDKATVSFGADIEPALSKVLETFAVHAQTDRGIASLAAMKGLLKELCGLLDKCGEENAVSDLCAFILNAANRERIPVFLVIEASEAVRDAFPAEFARTMGAFLERARPLLAQGMAVCVSEGYEARDDCLSGPRFFDDDLRLTTVWDDKMPSARGLGLFFDNARTTVAERPDLAPLGHWIDQRLDLLADRCTTTSE